MNPLIAAGLAHLRQQGRRAFCTATERCAYRTDEGLSDPVGAILGPAYTPAMEGKSVFTLADEGLLPEWLMPNVKVLQELQNLHDVPAHWNSAGLSPEGERVATRLEAL